MKVKATSFFSNIQKAKVFYYAKNILRQAIPTAFYKASLNRKLKITAELSVDVILDRVNYYNKLKNYVPLNNENVITLKDLPIFKSPKAYNFDTFEYTRYFNKELKAKFLFGDITYVADVPAIQKSRPIAGDNANAVLLNLDKKRHFVFVNDSKPFTAKKNVLVGRGVISQPHRIRFFDKYFDHPMCNLGQVNTTGGNSKWLKPKLSINEHLDYKFILSLEGNDVATNLKWIMSSNSIAVMPKPRYETWFMEGCLIANYHYILIEDDYSNLEEKLNYYITHPKEAELIIKNANEHVRQFLNQQTEDLVSLLVLQKYFKYTMQADNKDRV